MRAGGFTNKVAFKQGGFPKSQASGRFSAGLFADDFLRRIIPCLACQSAGQAFLNKNQYIRTEIAGSLVAGTR